MIPNSIRYLSATNSGPSSLAFSPDGRFLLVTEKITNNIDVFSVQSDGSLSQPKVTRDRFLVSSMWFFLSMALL